MENNNQNGLSDEVIIEIVHSIKDIIVELIPFYIASTRQARRIA